MRKLISICLSLIPFLAYAGGEWCITVLPEDTVAGYNPATVANGEIGLVVGSKPMSIDRVICGGAYHDGSENGVSCIVEGINPVNLLVSVDGIQVSDFDGWVQELDMYGAVHKTCFNARGLSVTSSIKALRHMPYAAMADIEIKAERDISAMFVNIHKIPESLDAGKTEHRRVWCEDGGRKLLRSQASYNRGKDIIVATSVMIPDENCIQKSADTVIMKLKEGQHASFSLISSICTTQSFSDPWNESERQVIYAIRQGREALKRQHGLRWADLWKGDITVEGNQDLTRIARFALFNLYGSIREGSRRSIPPMGLTSRGYNGHIFWDAETWIFPVLLKLHPHLAKEMISYRIDRLESARRRAYVYGYGGAMFPWESDHQGEESTPTFALTGPLEHHITADVAIAAWQYFEETTDTVWLREEGFPLMRECAEFWLSRADINDDGSFSIRNVVGADEYAIGVDNNAYTNGAVIRALELTSEAAEACGVVQDYRWKDMASRLRIHRSSSGVTLEHEHYNGEMIKQADVNLLAFPLEVETDLSQIRRDLEYYEEKIDPADGPAMSHSVLAVLYWRLGMRSKAFKSLEQSYTPNLRRPFCTFQRHHQMIRHIF